MAAGQTRGEMLAMSARPILSVGALTADLMMQVERLPTAPGKYASTHARMVAAGMATSAATAVVRLGRAAHLWATAGRDALGDFVLAEIKRDGIDTGHVRRIDGAMTAVAAILLDSGGDPIVVPRYDEALLSAPDAVPDFSAYAAVLADVRWPAAAEIALDGARAAGIPAILDLDVGARPILDRLAHRANHVVASAAGARVLTGMEEPAIAVAALARLTGATVVVTAGERGAWFRPAGGARPSTSQPSRSGPSIRTRRATRSTAPMRSA